MIIQTRLETKLHAAFAPTHLQVLNESKNHSVPRDSETHFKVTVVSSAFDGLGGLQRHRAVYEVLAEELRGGVHALTLHLFTPQEWTQRAGAASSPACRGGSGQ